MIKSHENRELPTKYEANLEITALSNLNLELLVVEHTNAAKAESNYQIRNSKKVK